MNKSFKFISIALVAVALSSCDFLNKLVKESYTNYEDYFTQELHYKKYNDIAALNAEIDNSSYFWTKNESEKYNNTTYYTGKSFMISVYNNKNDVYVYSNDGESVEASEKDGVVKFETKNIIIENGEKRRTNGAADEDELNMEEDNDGYLVVAFKKFMFYVTKDLVTLLWPSRNSCSMSLKTLKKSI